MKRLLALALCLIVVLSLGGCGKKKKKSPEDLLNDALNQAGDIYGDMLGDIDSLTSDISGLIPDVGGVTSDISGLIPDVGGVTSNIAGLVPNVNGNGAHTHSYSAATCDEPQLCACGEKRGYALGHDFKNGVCTRCGESDPDFVEVSYITVSPMSKTVYVGESFTLTATAFPYDATNKNVTWSSSNNSVASVSSSGKVTARGIGSATITAESANGKTSTCSVNVEAISLADCTLLLPTFPKELNYKVGPNLFHSSVIHKVSYELQEDNGFISIELTISGRKTYDFYGADDKNMCYLQWELYNMSGHLVESGIINTPSIVVGATYSNLRETIISPYNKIPVGTYRLEFIDSVY